MNVNAKSPLQRLLAMVLCVAILAGFAMPAMATVSMTADTLSNGAVMLTSDSDSDVVLNKGATLEEDGTYTIDLNAYATGDSETTAVDVIVPLDVIFVLDSSGSMVGSTNDMEFANTRAKALYGAAKEFMDVLKTKAVENKATTADTEPQVAVVTFGSGGGDSGTIWKWGGVNGMIDYYCNTGMFVNGQFKNYAVEDPTATVDYYEPVWDLDTSKKYVCFAGTYSATDGNLSHKREVSYKDGVWTGSGGDKTPMTVPYEAASKRQFMEKTQRLASDIVVTDADYQNTLMGIMTETDKAYAGVNKIVSKGSTYTLYGMQMAYHILEKNPARTYIDYTKPKDEQVQNAKRIVILFTDGNTDSTKTAVGDVADQIKGLGAEIYTVGVGDLNADNKLFLQKLSSNYAAYGDASPDATKETNYYFSATDTEQILEFFNTISGNVTSSATSITLDHTAIMRDYMNDGFELPEDFNAVDNVEISLQKVSTTDDRAYAFGDEYSCTPGENNTYTTSVTINDEMQDFSLKLDFDLDKHYVGVTGFDYGKYYVAKEHDGLMLKVKIKSIKMTANVTLDEVINTNKGNSGIGGLVNGEYVPVYYFPEPKTKAMSKTYVMDYAKSFEIYPCAWFETIKGIGTAPTITEFTDENKTATITTDYGTFTGKAYVDDSENPHPDSVANTTNHLHVTFSPKTMQWDKPASLFILGKFNEENQPAVFAEGEKKEITTGNYMWGQVNVIPANNIYYEDDFISKEATEDEAGRVGIVYTGKWGTEGSTEGDTENPEISENKNYGGVHGWEDNLADDSGYSDGSVHWADASDPEIVENEDGTTTEKYATATFTFTGTGVDIYSRTNGETGTVLATLTTQESGKTVNKHLIVDNVSESGDYYQVPTLSFTGLDYGSHTVSIRVTKGAANANNGKGRFVYYLDGIRVYNPIKDDSAYTSEEQNATFTEVRDLLATSTDILENSTVFIDKLGNETGKEAAAAIYNDTENAKYCPENEVYLAEGQSIIFKVDASNSKYFYVGLKAPVKDGSAKVLLSNGGTNAELTIDHTTDMYYKAVPTIKDGLTCIEVQNVDDNNKSTNNLLSVTKLRITTGTAIEGADPALLLMTDEEALSFHALFEAMNVEAYSPEVSAPEEPDDFEIFEDEVQVENPPVLITPDEETQPEEEAPVEPEKEPVTQPENKPATRPGYGSSTQLKNMMDDLFKNLFKWFR